MSAGQVRALDKLTCGIVDTDLPGGFASWMIDGGLVKIVNTAVEEERKRWLRAHCGLEPMSDFTVPELPGGKIDHYMQSREKSRSGRIILENLHDWNETHFNRGSNVRIMLYSATKSASKQMARQFVLPQQWIRFSTNPVRTLGLIDSGRIDHLRRRRLMFFSGIEDDHAVFLRVKAQGENDWNVCYQEGKDYSCIEEGTVVGFAQPIF